MDSRSWRGVSVGRLVLILSMVSCLFLPGKGNAGGFTWWKTFGGTGATNDAKKLVLLDGKVYLQSSVTDTIGDSLNRISCYLPDGTLLWEREMSSPFGAYDIYDFKSGGNGSLVQVGAFREDEGGGNAGVVDLFDADGFLMWTQAYLPLDGSDPSFNAVHVDNTATTPSARSEISRRGTSTSRS